MTISLRSVCAVLALAGFAIAIGACGVGSALLSDVRIIPDTISPNPQDRGGATIAYRLSRPAALSIFLTDEHGQVYVFRDHEPRVAGTYQATFRGVIATPVDLGGGYTVTQAAVLPDGVYTVTVDARDSVGQREQTHARLVIVKGDSTPPGFGDFSVFTPAFDQKVQATRPTNRVIFTPNRDGISDRIAVSYYLTKEATVEIYLIRPDDPDHRKYPIAEKAKLKPGRHDHDYEGGVDLGNSPPPDGEYLVVGEAIDAIGNHVVVTRPLTIRDGGVPLAQIKSSKIEPTVVPLDGLLRIEVVVENVGTVPIRSKGPYSGTVYTTEENYNTKGFYEEPGVFRVGADFEGNSAGRKYPFRWGFANDTLRPGETQTIVGYIRIVNRPPKVALYFWTGLEHEQVRTVNDKVNPVLISIGF